MLHMLPSWLLMLYMLYKLYVYGTWVFPCSHLLPPLLRRALQLSRLVIFGIEQVDVIRRVADQHLLTILTVAERRYSARLVGQVSRNKTNTHACCPPTHVVTWGWERGGHSVSAQVGGILTSLMFLCTLVEHFYFQTIPEGTKNWDKVWEINCGILCLWMWVQQHHMLFKNLYLNTNEVPTRLSIAPFRHTCKKTLKNTHHLILVFYSYLLTY